MYKNIDLENFEKERHIKLKLLIIISLFIALDIVLGFLSIQVGENLKIKITFIAQAFIGLIAGSTISIMAGAISDIIGFMIHPFGTFFPGYTLSAMLCTLIYSLFFYKKKINILKIVMAKTLINIFVNAGFGSLWSLILMGKEYSFWFSISIIKNLILLPFEIIILYLLFKALIPKMKKIGVIDNDFK